MPVKLLLWSDLTGPAFTKRIMVINEKNAIALKSFFQAMCRGSHRGENRVFTGPTQGNLGPDQAPCKR